MTPPVLPVPAVPPAEPLRLHLGGMEPRAGWKILNVQPGPGVDFVGTVTDLSPFADGSVAEIYASHVYEHVSYQGEVLAAFKEAHRVLVPGGKLMIGVPDLQVLLQLLNAPGLTFDQRFMVQRMIFGGQMDAHDYHKAGFTFEFLREFLRAAGFARVTKVKEFGLFRDTTIQTFLGVRISLNVEAVK